MGALKGLFGRFGWRGKLGLAATYLLGGYGVSFLMEKKEEELRGRMGNARYESQYGTGGEQARGLFKAGGLFFGAMSLIGRDYISRLEGSRYYWTEGRKLLRNAGTSAAVRNKILTTPRFGLLQAATVGMMARPGLLASSPEIALGIMGGAMVGGSAYGAYRADKFVQGKLGGSVSTLLGGYTSMAASAGAGAAGATLGYLAGSRANNPAAEGTVTDFQAGSVVSRMNWSTAGLGLAIHRKNRKI